MPSYYNGLNERLSTEQKQTNAVFIRDYLLAKGWSLTAICGMLGNFDAESQTNPNVYQDWTVKPDIGNYGYGLAQWTPWLGKAGYEDAESQRHYHGTNSPTFGRWCLDNGREKSEMETQLDYINLGLGGYSKTSAYPETFSEFKTTNKSVDYCAKLFYVNYERSAAGTWGDRPTRAESWYSFLTGEAPPPSEPDNPDTPVTPGTNKRLSKLLLYAIATDTY